VPAIVLMGPNEALDALRAQLPENSTVQTFTDHQVRDAVEFIAIHKPTVVAIEQGFAVSPRGEALIGRILDDPALSGCEIRVLALAIKAEREKARRKSGTGITPAVVLTAPPAATPDPRGPSTMDLHGTRRTERIRMLAGVTVTVDGNPAELVDLSAVGAQVISRMVLRPNQRVRVQLPDDQSEGRRALRCSASVVWASFEMPAGQLPRYRAGLKLSGAEADALHHFALLHRVPVADQTD
jgi:PilZ domain